MGSPAGTSWFSARVRSSLCGMCLEVLVCSVVASFVSKCVAASIPSCAPDHPWPSWCRQLATALPSSTRSSPPSSSCPVLLSRRQTCHAQAFLREMFLSAPVFFTHTNRPPQAIRFLIYGLPPTSRQWRWYDFFPKPFMFLWQLNPLSCDRHVGWSTTSYTQTSLAVTLTRVASASSNGTAYTYILVTCISRWNTFHSTFEPAKSCLGSSPGVAPSKTQQQHLCSVSASELLAPCCDTSKYIDNLNLTLVAFGETSLRHTLRCKPFGSRLPWTFAVKSSVSILAAFGDTWVAKIRGHQYRGLASSPPGHLGCTRLGLAIMMKWFHAGMSNVFHSVHPFWKTQESTRPITTLRTSFFQRFLSRDVTTASCTIVNLKCVPCGLLCPARRCPSVQSKAPRYPFWRCCGLRSFCRYPCEVFSAADVPCQTTSPPDASCP